MSRLQAIKSAVAGQSWKSGVGETHLSIYELIKADHEQIHNICMNILQEDDAGSERVWNLFREMRELFGVHIKAEECAFYNVLHDCSLVSDDDELRFYVMQGFADHHLLTEMLLELAELNRSSAQWMPKMDVLSVALHRHFDKEETELFEGAKRALKVQDSYRLAEEYLEEKDVLATETH
jgi:hypothetical protein